MYDNYAHRQNICADIYTSYKLQKVAVIFRHGYNHNSLHEADQRISAGH